MLKFRYFLPVLIVLIFVACQKETSILSLETASFSGAKGHFGDNDNGYYYWQTNDSIWVNGQQLLVNVTNSSPNHYNATVDVSQTPTLNGAYWAASPASHCSLDGSQITVAYPLTEYYSVENEGVETGHQHVVCPMVGREDNGTLKFENAGAMIRVGVALEGTNSAQLKEISLYSDGLLSGKIKAHFDNGSWSYSSIEKGQNRRHLYFSSGLSLTNQTQDFYLAIPPVGEGTTLTLAFTFVNSDQSTTVLTRTKSGSILFNRSSLYDLGDYVYNGESHTISGFTTSTQGSETNPYLISSVSDWATVVTYASQTNYFRLMSDITMGTTTITEFAGVLDGNGHAITVQQPLINTLKEGGKVINLTIRGQITSSATSGNIGALVNTNNKGTIEHCTNYASVTVSNRTSDAGVGGLIGKCSQALLVSDCDNYGTISITGCTGNCSVGGVGGVLTNAYHCTNYGQVSGVKSSGKINIGGVAGTISMTANDCRNFGSVSFTLVGYVGGVAGRLMCDGVNFVNRGSVSATRSSCVVGGIVGLLYSNDGGLYNSYCYATITGGTETNDTKGGIVGKVQTGTTVSNCYYWSDTPTYIFSFDPNISFTTSYCFGPNLNSNTGASLGSTCQTLANATTLTSGTSLCATLNNQVSSINDAKQWTEQNGLVTLVD